MKRIFTKLLVVSVLLMTIPYASAYAKTVVIKVQNFSFSPASVPNVVIGDIIRWEWVSGTHTTTSTTIPADAAAWDSPVTAANPAFEYTVTVAGVYNYLCTPHAPDMKAAFTVTVATGIADNTSIFGNLLLSPNPASETVRVSFNPSSPFKGSIKLFDMLGNNLWKSEAVFDAGLNYAEVSLAYIPKGVYFIELSDNRNNKVVKRLIVR